MLRRFFLTVWLTFALAPIGWAQPKVDFSGTWKLHLEWLVKNNPSLANQRAAIWRIEQTDTELRVSGSDGPGVTYKLDGSESVNKGGFNTSTTTTTTTTATWDGPRLVLRSKVRLDGDPYDVEFHGTFVFSLVGSVLTFTITYPQVLPSGDRLPTSTMVFTKQ
jgi:hypothetical protein